MCVCAHPSVIHAREKECLSCHRRAEVSPSRFTSVCLPVPEKTIASFEVTMK